MLRVVDLFCGIGGVSEAVRTLDDFDVVAAIDIDRTCCEVHSLNHGLVPACRTLESIRELPTGDLVWLSPPCQPYTRRGRGSAEHDPRSAALAHLISIWNDRPPNALILENVPQFEHSVHHHALVETLNRHGLATSHQILCPTQWGVPMRRRRFYLRAIRGAESIPDLAPEASRSELFDYLDDAAWDDARLRVSGEMLCRFESAMDLVDAHDPHAVTACFTSAYSNSPVRAGSYLRCRERNQVRRFSATEIASLMGYRRAFAWPDHLSLRRRYSLLGNALSVTVTRALIESFHMLTGCECG